MSGKKEKGSSKQSKTKKKVNSNLSLYMIISKNDYEKDITINKIIDDKFKDYHSDYLTLENDIPYIESVIKTRSLVNDNKVVFITYPIKSLGKKYSITKPKKKTWTYEEKLIEIFSEVNNDNMIIILLPDTSDKRKSLQKFVTENFKYLEIEETSDDKIKSFINEYVKKNKGKISSDACKYIIDNVNKDMYLVKAELDKLLMYSNNIDLEIAKDLVVISSEVAVFDIIDSIAKKDLKNTIKLIDGYMTSNDNIFALIVLLQRNFRLMYYAGLYKNNFADKLKLNKFIADKYLSRVKSFNQKELVKKMQLLIDVECNLKTGLNPNMVVYDLALSLIK